MENKRYVIWLLMILILLAAAGSASCKTRTAIPTEIPDYDGDGDPFIGMPNPASFYCQEMGYDLNLVETNQGTIGVCTLPDGAECEEWDFLAGACGIEWTFCARQGHSPEAGDEMAICKFKDGTTCPEYDFFISECLAPN